MTLDNLKDGQKAIIVNLSAQKELKNRLLSFGFIKNKNLRTRYKRFTYWRSIRRCCS